MPHTYPTIVLAYGMYGWDRLVALLESANARGLLVWESETEGGDPADRQLRNLRLIWVSDGSDNKPAPPTGAMLADLVGQITRVGGSRANSESRVRACQEAVTSAERDLLAAGGDGAVGLDVFVLAQPTGLSDLGGLEQVVRPLMAGLSTNQVLAAGVGQNAALTVSLFLDFEAVRRPAANDVRAEVVNWITRLHQQPPGLSRVYVMDGDASDGRYREASVRDAELEVFLELLLFEGQRQHTVFRQVYHRSTEGPAVTAFGVRVIERGTGLCARIAAADCGWHWLGWMMDRQRADHLNTERDALRKAVQSWCATGDERGRDDASVSATVGETRRDLETKLLEHAVTAADDPAWLTRCDTIVDEALVAVREARVAEMDSSHDDTALKAMVTRALQGGASPLPVPTVLDVLTEVQAEYEEPAEDLNTEAPSDRFADLATVHRKYRAVCAGLVRPERLRLWWIVLSAVTAAALTPVVLEMLELLPTGTPTASVWIRMVSSLRELRLPMLVSGLLWGGGWLLARYVGERMVTERRDRVHRLFTDPENGRLISRIRHSVRHGAVGDELRELESELGHGKAREQRKNVLAAMDQAVTALEDRAQEIAWLKQQLHDFLSTHGRDPEAARGEVQPVSPNVARRTAADRGSELERRQGYQPTDPDSLVSMQREAQPLTNWWEAYDQRFLHPIRFLDSLVAREAPATGSDDGEGEPIVAELREPSVARLPVGFQSAVDGIPVETYAVGPQAWGTVPEVHAALQTLGNVELIESSAIDRLYVLRVQSGTTRLLDG